MMTYYDTDWRCDNSPFGALTLFKHRPVITLLVLTGTASSTIGQATFRGIGEAPVQSCAYAVSGDGTTVVGVTDVPGGFEAFLWTESGGLQTLGDLPGGYDNSVAQGVSNGGTVVVGWGREVFGADTRGFRWTAATGMTAVNGHWVSDVSDNGNVIVGNSLPFCNIGLLTCADDCSVNADGSVLVYGRNRVVCHGGGNATGESLGTGIVAVDVSPDGNFVVGVAGDQPGNPPFLWNGGLQYLGASAGMARGVSADGTVVVGEGTNDGAFIWDALNGRRSLKDVLENEYCLDLTGWNLTVAYGISDDGLTIVGCGTDPNHLGRAWIARLPATQATTETNCGDGIDDDCDGYVDCADADCASNAMACPSGRIPAVSAWGVVVLTLATLSAGTLIARRTVC